MHIGIDGFDKIGILNGRFTRVGASFFGPAACRHRPHKARRESIADAIAKDGSSRTALATDLAAPYNIAVDDNAVFVTARDGAQIVRFEKAALAP